jgi:hypothetical protein
MEKQPSVARASLRHGRPALLDDEAERPSSPNGRAYAVTDGNP